MYYSMIFSKNYESYDKKYKNFAKNPQKPPIKSNNSS